MINSWTVFTMALILIHFSCSKLLTTTWYLPLCFTKFILYSKYLAQLFFSLHILCCIRTSPFHHTHSCSNHYSCVYYSPIITMAQNNPLIHLWYSPVMEMAYYHVWPINSLVIFPVMEIAYYHVWPINSLVILPVMEMAYYHVWPSIIHQFTCDIPW